MKQLTPVAVAALLLALLSPPAPTQAETSATEATPKATPDPSRSGKPADPLTLLDGSPTAWSTSRTEAGCYLISPFRKNTSRLAIGRHPTLGLGLFAVSFPLATKPDAVEPVTLHANDRDIDAPGRVVLANLVFVALDAAAVEVELAELLRTGTLWLQIRETWIMHDGDAVREAIATYRSACDAPAPSP